MWCSVFSYACLVSVIPSKIDERNCNFRERERETDGQTGRQTGRQVGRQIDRQTQRERGRGID